jgi:hypothetical protein
MWIGRSRQTLAIRTRSTKLEKPGSMQDIQPWPAELSRLR